MEKARKVLCLFDYLAGTGFSTVSTNIKRELKKHFGNSLQLDIVAINYFGEPIEEKDGSYVISAIKSASQEDKFGRLGFLKILKDCDDYDGIFIIQDLSVVCPIVPLLKAILNEKKENKKRQFKSIFYFPIDSRIIAESIEGLDFFDTIVAYTEYGRNEVLRLNPKLKNKIIAIPHGNNSKDFYPLPEEEKLAFRKEFFGENADKFIITNVNRNQPRKDLPATILAFIEAKKRWKEEGITKEPFLYLHTHPLDPMGNDLFFLFKQTDLIYGVDYKMPTVDEANVGATVETLNKIYNASDVSITTTLGEGWGLTFSEAAATQTPIICPLSTSFIEMSDNGQRAYVIDDFIPSVNDFDNMVRDKCNVFDVAETILYVAKGMTGLLGDIGFDVHYADRVKKAYLWAKSLEWSEVCKRWIDEFKRTY